MGDCVRSGAPSSVIRSALLTIVLGAALAGCGRADARAQDSGDRPPAASSPPTVVLTIHYSHWSASHVSVKQGSTVRFVVHNHDPIDHELIIGDAGVQDRHERGTEAKHGLRPGEIPVPAGTTAITLYTFESAGGLLFGCHLPGHWAYGMHGTIDVTS